MPIDLRSDTITKPTPEMRAAIAAAEVGDDVLGDDPTVIALEKKTAEILGKEAALYTPSGTMANQIAIRCHTRSGDEVVTDANAHCHFYEVGAPAALSGVTMRLIDAKRGIFTADDLAAAIRPANVHFPQPSLVCIENTHNRGGGSIWPLETLAGVSAEAHKRGMKLHMDGARLWNAAVASGICEADFAKHVDSVSVCFSKGLGAPVGSAVAGTKEFIARARRVRKLFGGGMRQVGIIAAGALYALEHNRARLADDHANAKTLAAGLAALPGVKLDPKSVETNIVFFDVLTMPAADLAAKLEKAGVWLMALGPNSCRAVTCLEVGAEDIERALVIVKKILC
ncbi:MAG: aminotransferase class I/II-fold pyridoxal phosphate-dependent enzyme [Planctomycetaceae bacterium]|nr:aminotransferase class I/II-fold pyridoxal phosphate-dependent enzyme [Planctomycetaceae bacterium]